MTPTVQSSSRDLSGPTLFLVWGAIVLYWLACFLPAIETEPGFACLLFGWMVPPWFANIALYAGMVALAFQRFRAALFLAIAAMLLALTTPLMFSHLRVGYFFWQASMVAFCVGVMIEHRRSDRTVSSQP